MTGPERTTLTDVIQEYNVPRMLESELSHMDLPIAISELIDNAIDETPAGETSQVVVTFDARDNRVVFENSNTTGMDPGKMQDFVSWGQEHTNPSKLKEHGQGGKLGILYLLDKEKGSLTITSSPQNSSEIYQLKLENWWRHQNPGERFPINMWQNSDTKKPGYTRFELENVKPNILPSKTAELADRLGFVYGPLLAASRVTIKLRRISKSGKLSDDFNVLPIILPFEESTKQTRDIGIEGGKIKMKVIFGMIDATERERSARHRQKIYDAAKVFEPPGEIVRIYNHGKLLDEELLSRFGITRKKMTLYNFAAAVYITDGFVRKTILKTGLSKSDPVSLKILDAVKRIITPYITDILGDSDRTHVSENDIKRAADATSKMALILLGMFGNNPGKIRAELNLPSDIYDPAQNAHEAVRKGQGRSGTVRSLPGIKGSELKPREFKIGRMTSTFPEIRIVPYGQNFPNASLRRDELENKLVIALNYNSPDVRTALETRGAPGLAQILRIAAEALYHQKWISISPNDSQLYSDGIKSDVANFLVKAEEMKIT